MILREAIRWNYLVFMTAFFTIFTIAFTMLGHDVLAVLCATSIIVWWGFIPGFVSIYLKEISMGDFFVVMMVPHFGVLPVAVWGFFNVIMQLVFGKLERPIWVFRGAIVAFITVLFIPFLFKLAGGSVLVTMYYFTILFYVFMGMLALLVAPAEFFEDIKMVSIAIPIAMITNSAYVILFGPFTTNLMQNGMKLDATSIIFFALILIFIVVFKFVGWYARHLTEKHKKKSSAWVQPAHRPTHTPEPVGQ